MNSGGRLPLSKGDRGRATAIGVSNDKEKKDVELLDLVSSDDDNHNEHEDEESDSEVESVTPFTPSPPPPPPKKPRREEEEVKESIKTNAKAKKEPGDGDGGSDTGGINGKGQEFNLVYVCRHCPGKTFTPLEKKGHQIFHKLRKALKKKLAEPPQQQQAAMETGTESESEASEWKPQEKEKLSSKPEKVVVERGGRRQYEVRVKVGVTHTGEGKSKPQADSESESEYSEPATVKKPRARVRLGVRPKIRNRRNTGGRGKATVKEEKPEETEDFVENLAISAKFASLYRCKKCPEDVLFTEEDREKHRHQFHRNSKNYDVDEHQDDYVVAFCFKCPHLAVPLSGWEDHLRQHRLARLFVK